MNNGTHDDKKWQALLAASAPSFAGESTPPYGFVTHTLAQIRAGKKQQEAMEKIGLRALWASLTVLAAAVVITVGLQLQDRPDLDPGINSLIQADRIAIS